jgi:pyruvate,water dikinase
MSLMPDWLVPLSAPEACQASRVGSKAANLAALVKAGFEVPRGFVITTKAQAWAGDMPPAGKASILQAYQDLAGPVAVRSSATAEDLPDRSFAGQYETTLEVNSEAGLWAAIRRCWDSLDSERAQAYRNEAEAPGSAPVMAVLVQRMVPAEVSGVLFTVDPLTRERGRMLINATKGLGEALVSGRITPDEYRVDRASGSIAARPSGETPVLPDTAIRELCAIAQRIEAHFGAPQDIEWCWAQGRFSILQARPITTLSQTCAAPALQVLWGHPTNASLAQGQVVFWSNWNTRENLPYPLKPLAWSFFNDMAVPEVMAAIWGIHPASPLYPYNCLLDLVNGRAYWNMSMLLGRPLMGRAVLRQLKIIDQEAGATFERLLASGEFKPFRLPIGGWRQWGSFLTGVGTVLGFPWLASPEALQRRCDHYWEQATAFESTPVEGKSAGDLLGEIRRFVGVTARFGFPMLFVAGKSMLAGAIIQRMTRPWTDLHPGDLMAGMAGDKTMETALELYRLSRVTPEVERIYLDPALVEVATHLRKRPEGRAFLERLERFLETYGHRGTKDLDLGHPSWKEDPSFIHQMIRSYLKAGPADWNPLSQFQAAVDRREATRVEIERRLGTGWFDRMFPLRRWIFRACLRRLFSFFPLRENFKFYGVKMFPGSRRILAEIGRRYVERGWLEAPQDLYFLTVEELERQEREPSPESLAATIRERKARWQSQLDSPAPFIIRSDGRPVEGLEPAQAGDRLKGLAASQGRITGIARVIREPSEGHRLGKGEILVAPTTEPGWAPLFLLAGGLVMEVGGAICHGAIVAREYGIPAVVGARGATSLIQDGETITVDGYRGEILRHGF